MENLHHIYWERRQWAGLRNSSEIRNHERSKITMDVGVHRELHHYVDPIQPPARLLAHYMLADIRGVPNHYDTLDGIRHLEEEWFETEAHDYSEHLFRQIPFLELSKKALRRKTL